MNPGLIKIGVWYVRFIWQRETAAERIKKSKCRYSSDTRNKKEIKGFVRVGRLYFIVQWCPNE